MNVTLSTFANIFLSTAFTMFVFVRAFLITNVRYRSGRNYFFALGPTFTVVGVGIIFFALALERVLRVDTHRSMVTFMFVALFTHAAFSGRRVKETDEQQRQYCMCTVCVF